MGLEYKCPSLHYHSPETLSALCLPFYQHNPPPRLLLLFQTGNRFGDFYYLMHSGCSAPITDECLVPLVRSDSPHQIFLVVGLHSNSGNRVLQQFSPWMFTFMSCALNESLHIAQTSIHCQEKLIAAGRCAMHIVLWLLYQKCITVIVVWSHYCNVWNLQPCQERRNLLYRLVDVAVCVPLCSA